MKHHVKIPKQKTKLTGRYQGCIRTTYEVLASILGMEIGSIQFIEINRSSGMIRIYHEDDSYSPCFDLAEGQTVPETSIPTEKLMKNMAKAVSRYQKANNVDLLSLTQGEKDS